jgi:hypothetical protein
MSRVGAVNCSSQTLSRAVKDTRRYIASIMIASQRPLPKPLHLSLLPNKLFPTFHFNIILLTMFWFMMWSFSFCICRAMFVYPEAGFSETSVTACLTTRCYNPQDHNVNLHCRSGRLLPTFCPALPCRPSIPYMISNFLNNTRSISQNPNSCCGL